MDFTESAEQQQLRVVVAELAAKYGWEYTRAKAAGHEAMDELWAEAGRLGFLGVNLPAEYGGGGAGMYELALVAEELNAGGTGLLMMVVSPAIVGTILARFGTDGQRAEWLPRLASGEAIAAFAITEPDAGSNSHRITTTARRDGGDWLLSGRKTFISGVDQADAVLVVGRIASSDASDRTPARERSAAASVAGERHDGTLRPALFLVPTDQPGFEFTPIEMDITMADRQFQVFLDDVRLPASALVGEDPDGAMWQLFAGLNPERIMAAAGSIGAARFALDKAASYATQRQVWDVPIGAHQGIAHPLAEVKVELELAKLMLQKAATIYDSGDDRGAGEAANMAKYAAAEVAVRAVDRAVQTHGGNGLATEYGLGSMLAFVRLGRIAPVSREMLLNFVAQTSLGLPKSY
jgi:alkylation response protein AidB-like acyl-CoA dehydrogenase